MHTGRSKVAVLAMVLAVAGVIPTNAQAPQALQKAKAFQRAVTLPAAGTFDGGGTFAGTATINRFEQRGNQIVAIGLVTGVLSKGGGPLGSAVVGEVTWPVALRTGGQVLAAGRVGDLGTPSQIAW